MPGQARALHARRYSRTPPSAASFLEVLARLVVVRTGQEVVHLIEQANARAPWCLSPPVISDDDATEISTGRCL